MSILAVSDDDPQYLHRGPARLIRDILDAASMSLIVDGRMNDVMAVDSTERTIWLPPSLPWRTAHERINRGFLYLIGGSEWAPEFRDPPPKPTLRLVPPGATTLPIVRRVW